SRSKTVVFPRIDDSLLASPLCEIEFDMIWNVCLTPLLTFGERRPTKPTIIVNRVNRSVLKMTDYRCLAMQELLITR
ncbi:MAG: hypothetical protein ACFE7R_10005, partial [Candidatus Hodarchaeota archaeon]